MRVRFAGTLRLSLTCQPAPSSTSAACVPAGTARDSSARKRSMAAVETSGRTSATPSPRSGRTAPDRWAELKPCCRTPRGRAPLWYQTWVIPTALVGDRLAPLEGVDGGEPVGRGHEPVPRLAAGRDDRRVA